MKPVRVRFAPSPTGHLHIGGARTALFNYLFAKKQGGKYILRIEDTDQARNQAEADVGFIKGFRWLNLLWDEGPDVGGEYGPYSSMERISIYQPYIDQLLADGKAYPCYCSKEELEREREAAAQTGQVYRYSGKCRNLSAETRQLYEQEGRDKVIRLRVKQGEEIRFQDMVRGEILFRSNDLDDYVLVKSNGIPVYNLAATIDDSLMEITHVIRGEEHISNTPCQILLYRAFGWEVPTFAHLPLILNQDGRKLSKRDESIIQFIDQYQERGYLPEAINNYLALLGWSPSGEWGEQELFSIEELIQQFSFERVGKSGAIFDPEKLAWMNGQYIKQADLDHLVDLAVPFLQQAGFIQEQYDREWVSQLVAIYQKEMNCMSEIVDLTRLFFTTEPQLEQEAREVLEEESAQQVISTFQDQLAVLDEYEPTQIKKLFKKVQKQTGLKGKKLFMPVRVKTTGQTHGPDLNTTLYLLGKEKVLARLESTS